ncbi:hypothetical protein LCGC14_2522280 [marine sediment metagenome]|uniref:Uncharacterized protein n=1 Tax=marine sediment metagenome TaxID=412755 RepID=A0A0F9BJ08_9ZZZZ
METQDLVIKNGKIQLKLDRLGEPTIVEIPEKFKDKALLDLWQESIVKAYDTLNHKPVDFRVRTFKAWVLDKEGKKFRLVDGNKFLKQL